MIDTHCHLTDPRITSQLPAVLGRAHSAGVTRIVTIGTDLQDDRECVKLCQSLPMLRCVVGVHPNYVNETDESHLPQLREIQSDPSVVALGEMGLDYHYGSETKDRQKRFFEYQLQLATEVNKPIVIHCREAVSDCLAILANFPQLKLLFHCFTGTPEEAKQILDRGYLLGFTGVITFKNSQPLRDVIAFTPWDRIVVETDAPYLSPEPFRKQKVNEPALVIHTAAEVARIKNVTIEKVDEETTKNAFTFYGNW